MAINPNSLELLIIPKEEYLFKYLHDFSSWRIFALLEPMNEWWTTSQFLGWPNMKKTHHIQTQWDPNYLLNIYLILTASELTIWCEILDMLISVIPTVICYSAQQRECQYWQKYDILCCFCTLMSCLLSEKENSVKPAMQYFSPSVSVRILVVAKNNTWANYFNWFTETGAVSE